MYCCCMATVTLDRGNISQERRGGGGATSLCLKRVTVTKATLQSSTDVVVVDLLCAIQVGGPRLTGKTTRFLTHNGSVGKKMGVRPS